MNALIFPGQGSQFVGMGKDLYESYEEAKKKFLLANKILGFDITALDLLPISFSGYNVAETGLFK